MSTDSEIIRRSIEQPRAFAELFDRHARVIGGFAARRVGSEAAEDVVSETFLVAFRRRASFDQAVESSVPWLLGIASRLTRKHRAQEAKNWRSIQATADQRIDHSHDGTEPVIARLDAASSTRQLAPLIAALSPKDRETLLLYAWGDLTYEEVASALGVPVGTVRSRLNRVRRRLDPGRSARMEQQSNEKEGEVDGRVGTRA
ncbi:RNA polymerase sigma factor [Microbacterium sp. LWH12-1.2]|uniref:RNA polymerase sigma factor n=1 Tax=Microbacterium sp. LWH12-1.2 TaxID=3135259 RepID=UPI00344046CD